ncbi:hypothetical protein NGM10_06200 [Halorussus salilacus]|uniref:hypothetical protein n=1 Tax=Halorussus salilacus TaxID=2953750 RepID=UPI0020A04CF8|nr:hypothetical protein [Halorussus salilacus]USZ69326.1 hypothetical protein NGM10_06200 [Halorussus salilacus]
MVSRPVDSDLEVNGRTVCQAVDGLTDRPADAEARGRAILAENGIESPPSEKWYALADFLAALDDIGSALGEETVTRLGAKVPEGVDWPSEVESATDGFETVDDAYHLNHRGGDIGHYEFAEVGERERRVTCANPYPCAFDRGIIEGTLRAFGEEFNYTPMVFIHETSERCRDEGGEQCTYRVTW